MLERSAARTLRPNEKSELERWIAEGDEDRGRRARILLLWSQGTALRDIAEACGSHPVNVKKWIQRYVEQGVAGLDERKRGPKKGTRARFSEEQERAILDLAAQSPESLGYEFSSWSPQKLADAAVERGIVSGISHVTVRQMLKGAVDREDLAGDGDGDHPAPLYSAFLHDGEEALKRGENREALDRFREALALDDLPLDVEATIRCLLAEALEGLASYEEALDVVRRYEDATVFGALPERVRGRIKIRLGWIYSWLHNFPRAVARLNEALRICDEIGDQQAVSETHFALGRIYREFKESNLARDHLDRAIELQRHTTNHHFLAQVYLRRGTVEFDEGNIDKAIEFWEKARELAQGLSDDNLLGLISMNLGVAFIHADRGERDRATEDLEVAIHHYERGGHRGFLAQAYNNLGDNLRFAGDWPRAVECLERSLALGREAGDPIAIALPLVTLGEIAFRQGLYVAAEARLDEALDLIRKIEHHWCEAYTLRVLGSLYAGTSRSDEALQTFGDALRLAAAIRDQRAVLTTNLLLGQVHFDQGHLEQAEDYLQAARGDLNADPSYLGGSGLARRLAGLIDFEHRRFAEAQQSIAQSISIFTAVADLYEVGISQMCMGELLMRVGDLAQSDAHLQQAREIFKRLGATPDLVKVERLASATNDRPQVSDGATPVETHRASDVLLLQRLMDASASRELLLQELVSVVEENFSPGRILVLVCDHDDTASVELARAIPDDQIESLKERILTAIDRGGRVDGGVVHILDDRVGCRVVVYLDAALSTDRLRPLLKQAELGLENCALRGLNRHSAEPVRERLRPETVIPGFIYVGSAMRQVIERIHKIRTSDVTVLITGESGTGKELVARAVHAESNRRQAVFLPFNCTATPKEMIESQLFGHRRGAFTGAISNYPGIIRAAEGGTLFLDEIGDLALEVQPKLLRFLESGEIQPLGEAKPSKVDVRVVAATNSDLERAVADGHFREDLFHRVNIIRIHVPPLRERQEEIPVLAEYFLKHFVERSGKKGVRLGADAIDSLTKYIWPGNVRQLRNEMERVVAYAPSGVVITSDDLSPELAVGRGSRRSSAGGNGAQPSEREDEGVRQGQTLKQALAAYERKLIEESLERSGHDLSATAMELGLSRRGLHMRITQLGVRLPARVAIS